MVHKIYEHQGILEVASLLANYLVCTGLPDHKYLALLDLASFPGPPPASRHLHVFIWLLPGKGV